MSDTIGLRELRQQASDIVRQVEDGHELVVTVAGRPAARLVPIARKRWRTGRELQRLFTVAADPTWQQEHADRSDLVDHTVNDPWQRNQ